MSIQIRVIWVVQAASDSRSLLAKTHKQHLRKVDSHWRRVLAWLNNRTKDREQGSNKWSALTMEGDNQWSSPGTCSIHHVYKR